MTASRLLALFTPFGASNLVLSACVGLAAALWFVGLRRPAAAFIFSAGLCAAIISFGKIVFLAIHGFGGLYSPSGHAALACFFFCSFGRMAQTIRSPAGYFFAAASWSVALLVFFNRFLVGGHTFPDTVVGASVGLACSALFFRFAGPFDVKARLQAVAPTLAFTASVASYLAFGANISEHGLFKAAFWLRANLGL